MIKNNLHNIEIKISDDLINYEESLNLMQSRIKKIKDSKSSELIWFLEHDHIYTQGTSAESNEIVKKNNILILKSNRGGKTTYHGPGQRVIYFLIDLNKKKKDIRRFISVLENSVINFLSLYGVKARSFKDRVGIWVTETENIKLKKEMKIGAIGLRISKWITYHGLSVNINPDLKYYDYINACGLKNYKNTSLQELGLKVSKEEFDKKFLNIFLEKLSKI
tara:strand:+ start:50 stop:712 length:663 start_codon:yes stop_codon:yes gene_type:complete